MKNWISVMLVCLTSIVLYGCAAISSPSETANADASVTNDPATMAKSTMTSSTTQTGRGETKAPNEKTADTLLSFGSDMPSTQWFINDVKIQDYA